MLLCALQHDPQMQRFLSMRATFWEQFKPAPKNFLFAFSWTVLPMGLYAYYLHTSRVSFEQMYVLDHW